VTRVTRARFAPARSGGRLRAPSSKAAASPSGVAGSSGCTPGFFAARASRLASRFAALARSRWRRSCE
jgi:hypothetical protein